MNPDLSAPLTHEEFVSLRDCAKGLMHRTIPAEHKDRLIQLGYIQELSGGLRLTIRWQAEDCGRQMTDKHSKRPRDGNWQARDQAGRHHRIPTNQSADFSDGPLRLAQFD